MPTEKRARQRALRAQKQAVIQKQRKRRSTRRRGATFAAVAAGIILIVVLIQLGPSAKKAAKPPTSSTRPPASNASSTSTTFPPPSTVPLSTAALAPVCPPAKGTKRRIVWFTKAPPHCIAKSSVWDATFDTSLGSFVVEMKASKSYAAVNNFVFLSKWNYFNGTFFHRVIPGFVIQGGDPTGLGTGGPHAFPGYSFTGNYPPASCKVKATAACYQPGDFVMANSNSNPQVQNASTDGSQFFVVLPGGQTQLNSEPTYTLFGKVISGMSVVDAIGADGTAGGTPKVKVYVLKVTLSKVKA